MHGTAVWRVESDLYKIRGGCKGIFIPDRKPVGGLCDTVLFIHEIMQGLDKASRSNRVGPEVPYFHLCPASAPSLLTGFAAIQ